MFDLSSDIDGKIRALNWDSNFQAARYLSEEQIVIEVGSGGEHATLNAALREASRLGMAYPASGSAFTQPAIVIRLLAGFVLEEQIFVTGVNLGYIRITSVDEIVSIARDALTETASDSRAVAFFGYRNAVMPRIACMFAMDTSGAADNQGGIMLNGASAIVEGGAGFSNAASRNCHLIASRLVALNSVFEDAGGASVRVGNNSSAWLRGSSLKGSNTALLVSGASSVQIHSGDLSGCNTAVKIDNASLVTAADADLTGAAVLAVNVSAGGSLDIEGADCAGADVKATGGGTFVNARGVTADNFTVLEGAQIDARGATGTLSQAKNAWTAEGIIWAAED
jgi:hypothetical protein